ncbi:MAG: universal stress protein [Desulfovibrionaceae bacterium]|nr:universal stress protein [Desulfovibrionaceae bacterium]
MKHITKVLMAVDLSEHTQSHMKTGTPILEQLGCTVVLIHCIPPLHELPSEYIPHENVALFIEEAVSAIHEQLQGVAQKYLSHLDVIIETPIGEPIVCINDYAIRYGCSMIIIGKSYKNTLERFFLGSVASTLVSSSNLPILLLG